MAVQLRDLRERDHLTVPELKRRYAEVFGEPTRTNHKQYLVKRIVWRMQALREGGLSERARRRALELADDAEIRLSAPKTHTTGSAHSGSRRNILPSRQNQRGGIKAAHALREQPDDVLRWIFLNLRRGYRTSSPRAAAGGRVCRPGDPAMNPQKIVGIVLLVVGVALLVIGLNSSNSIADQVSETFTGRFTQATTWYILGGLAAAVLGLLMLIGRFGKKNT